MRGTMDWVFWTIITLYVTSGFSAVLTIGKVRKPVTPGGAALSMITVILLIWAMFHIVGRF